MPRFTDAKKLANYLRQAQAEALKETVFNAQAELIQISPVDSGRFRANWMPSEGSPSNATNLGTGSPPSANNLTVRPGSVYFLVNNLVYAKPVALGENLPPSWGGQPRAKKEGVGENSRVDPNWYINFRDSRIPKIQEAAATTIKNRFDL